MLKKFIDKSKLVEKPHKLKNSKPTSFKIFFNTTESLDVKSKKKAKKEDTKSQQMEKQKEPKSENNNQQKSNI